VCVYLIVEPVVIEIVECYICCNEGGRGER